MENQLQIQKLKTSHCLLCFDKIFDFRLCGYLCHDCILRKITILVNQRKYVQFKTNPIANYVLLKLFLRENKFLWSLVLGIHLPLSGVCNICPKCSTNDIFSVDHELNKYTCKNCREEYCLTCNEKHETTKCLISINPYSCPKCKTLVNSTENKQFKYCTPCCMYFCRECKNTLYFIRKHDLQEIIPETETKEIPTLKHICKITK